VFLSNNRLIILQVNRNDLLINVTFSCRSLCKSAMFKWRLMCEEQVISHCLRMSLRTGIWWNKLSRTLHRATDNIWFVYFVFGACMVETEKEFTDIETEKAH
jgi:hypothetical protein